MLTPTATLQPPNAVDAARRASRRMTCVATLLIAAGAALHLPSLTWGFLVDDNLHQYILRGPAPGERSLRDLYDFGPHDSLADVADEWHFQVWWTDAAFKVRFFRPVTSFSLRLDYWLYRDWAPGYHVTSLVLFIVFLVLVHRLYLRLDLPPKAALWALAAVALNQAHTLPVGWIANRNTLLAALFTVATLLGVLDYERRRRRTSAVLTVVCFLCACGSKESGVAALPLAMLVLLFGGWGAPVMPVGRREGLGAAGERLLHDPLVRSLAVLAAAWLTFYVLSGHGAHSELYPAPWIDLGGYLYRLIVLVPAAFGSLFFCFPLDVVAACPPQSAVWIACVVLAAVVLAARVFVRVVPHGRLAGLGLGWIIVCLTVEAGGEVSDRLLMSASIGAGLLLGLFFDARGAPWVHGERRDRPALALSVVLFGANLVVAAPVSLFRGQEFAEIGVLDRQLLLDAEIDRSAPPRRDAFILNTPSALLLIECGPTWSMHYADRETYFYPLQAGRRGLLWKRTGERAMTLTARGAPFVDHRLERLFRYGRAPQLGDVFRTKAFRATVMAVEGKGVRTLLLEFDKPLEDPSYFFLRFYDGRLRRTAPPAPGQTLELAEVAAPSPFVP